MLHHFKSLLAAKFHEPKKNVIYSVKSGQRSIKVSFPLYREKDTFISTLKKNLLYNHKLSSILKQNLICVIEEINLSQSSGTNFSASFSSQSFGMTFWKNLSWKKNVFVAPKKMLFIPYIAKKVEYNMVFETKVSFPYIGKRPLLK